jgi:hypothetical protein
MVGWRCIKVFRVSLLYFVSPCIAIYGIALAFFFDFDQIKQGICLRNSFAQFKAENNQTVYFWKAIFVLGFINLSIGHYTT